MSAAYGGQCPGEDMSEYVKWRALWKATGDVRYVSLAPGGRNSDAVSTAVAERARWVFLLSMAFAAALVGLVVFLACYFLGGFEALARPGPELAIALVAVALMFIWVGLQFRSTILRPA